MTTDALIERLNAAGIPCGPIYTIDQTFADPQVQHLGIAQAVESPALGAIKLVGQPFSVVGVFVTCQAAVEGLPEQTRSAGPSELRDRGTHTHRADSRLRHHDLVVVHLAAAGRVRPVLEPD